MPCSYYGPSDDLKELQKELDRVTRLLCDTMHAIEDPSLHENVPLSTEVLDWWEEHQEKDEQRCENLRKRAAEEKERKRKEREKKRRIKAAKAKLTKEEIKLLGL